MFNTSASGSFTISRTINRPIAEVYAAFAEADIKQQWFMVSDGAVSHYRLDFQIGGLETSQSTYSDGMVHRFMARYYDIIPQERIIYSYEMSVNDQRLSVSVATIEFQEMGQQTQLSINEAGVFLDGLDTMNHRQQGTQQHFDALVQLLG